MSAALIVFPTEEAICFLCLGEFTRRMNADRRICSKCRTWMHQFHEQAEDHKRHLRASIQNLGGDVAAFDHAIEAHLQGILQ